MSWSCKVVDLDHVNKFTSNQYVMTLFRSFAGNESDCNMFKVDNLLIGNE